MIWFLALLGLIIAPVWTIVLVIIYVMFYITVAIFVGFMKTLIWLLSKIFGM